MSGKKAMTVSMGGPRLPPSCAECLEWRGMPPGASARVWVGQGRAEQRGRGLVPETPFPAPSALPLAPLHRPVGLRACRRPLQPTAVVELHFRRDRSGDTRESLCRISGLRRCSARQEVPLYIGGRSNWAPRRQLGIQVVSPKTEEEADLTKAARSQSELHARQLTSPGG